MAKQEFITYTDKRDDGYYSFLQYPEEEGGSLSAAGPFETEEEAKSRCEAAISLLKKIMPGHIKAIHRIQ